VLLAQPRALFLLGPPPCCARYLPAPSYCVVSVCTGVFLRPRSTCPAQCHNFLFFFPFYPFSKEPCFQAVNDFCPTALFSASFSSCASTYLSPSFYQRRLIVFVSADFGHPFPVFEMGKLLALWAVDPFPLFFRPPFARARFSCQSFTGCRHYRRSRRLRTSSPTI